MADWLRFIVAALLLAVALAVIVLDIRDCARTGGVLVEALCVRSR